MRRALSLMLVAAVAMLAVAWLAGAPGRASVEFAGWRLDTSFGGLAVLVAATGFAMILVDRAWRAAWAAPKRFADWRQARRTRKGYEAVTRGLVAIAAGDAGEAQRQARAAMGKLGTVPLVQLMSAQAAQLAGEEADANEHFEAMRAFPETEFAALRGLVAAAMKRGETERALVLARRARDLRPDAAWVSAALVELETASGAWAAAGETLIQARRNKLFEPALADGRAAAALHAHARALGAAGDLRNAIAAAERALRLGPDRPEVAATLAVFYARDARARAAGNLVEKEWARHPHPDLLAAYRLARPVANALQWVKQVERLAKLAPLHRESHIALAEAALAAGLWGEAKRHAQAALAAEGAGDGASDGPAPSLGLCRLLQRIAEAQGDDAEGARRWLARAAEANPDPAWTCAACGQPHETWLALCTHCGAFDRMEWRPPARPQARQTRAEQARIEAR
jgi:HemY protein